MELDTIIGGIKCKSSTIKHNGTEFTTGEFAKWNMRNKLIMFKHTPIEDTKCLLRIIGIKTRISFNRVLVYYDDGTTVNDDEKHVSNVMDDIKLRLNESVNDIINRLVAEYDLCNPLISSMVSIIKVLLVEIKKKRPTTKKIKISPELFSIISSVWYCHDRLNFTPSGNVVCGMSDLIVYLMNMASKYTKNGNWIEPAIVQIEYPILAPEIIKKTEARLKKLKSKKTTIDKYVMGLLEVENGLIDYIENIEHYYITVSNNNNLVQTSLKRFFR
jgi:hypothetical protein